MEFSASGASSLTLRPQLVTYLWSRTSQVVELIGEEVSAAEARELNGLDMAGSGVLNWVS